jgi:hypothetical protein
MSASTEGAAIAKLRKVLHSELRSEPRFIASFGQLSTAYFSYGPFAEYNLSVSANNSGATLVFMDNELFPSVSECAGVSCFSIGRIWRERQVTPDL